MVTEIILERDIKTKYVTGWTLAKAKKGYSTPVILLNDFTNYFFLKDQQLRTLREQVEVLKKQLVHGAKEMSYSYAQIKEVYFLGKNDGSKKDFRDLLFLWEKKRL